MQTDIFLYYFRKMRPAFSTFFLNSTAHLQHAYWRHMDPQSFEAKPAFDEIEIYGDAILHGYQNMDRLLPDFFKLEKQGVTLAIATALSQQPFLKYETSGGQRFYRPRDLSALLKLAGVRAGRVEPLMAHQYIIRFNNVDEKRRAVDLIEQIRCNEEKVFSVHSNDHVSIASPMSFGS